MHRPKMMCQGAYFHIIMCERAYFYIIMSRSLFSYKYVS